MRSLPSGILGVAIGLVLLGATFVLYRDPLQAQITREVQPARAAGELIALAASGEGVQQIVVIDSRSRVMSVYHVEHTSGTISLKSVRSIRADMEMDEFNTESPLPREIRAMLKK